jgi:metallophosphoesterase superfamily enzyme
MAGAVRTDLDDTTADRHLSPLEESLMALRFLQFSDIHFGQEKLDGTWEPHDDVREEALADITRVLSEGIVTGRADGILVTGDIAQRGHESEFKRASDWIQRVRAIACKDDAIVRTVPGNHDCNLDRLDATGQMVQDALRREDKILEVYAYLGQAAALSHNPLAPKLEDYRSFALAHASDFVND